MKEFIEYSSILTSFKLTISCKDSLLVERNRIRGDLGKRNPNTATEALRKKPKEWQAAMLFKTAGDWWKKEWRLY